MRDRARRALRVVGGLAGFLSWLPSIHGNLNVNRYDPDSVANPDGQYGNRYSSESVTNPYGAGSPYGQNSPTNPYGTGMRVCGPAGCF